MADSSPGRRLDGAALADCKPIPNSSMELNGAGWSGTVDGGNYHCRLVKSKSWIYDYKVDCTKSGGSDTRFYFNDGGDEYSLSMSSNTHHTVSYNGNPRIVSIRTAPTCLTDVTRNEKLCRCTGTGTGTVTGS